MPHYIPLTPSQEESMLKAVGAASKEELFSPVPKELRLNKVLDLPKALSESELKKDAAALASRNFDNSWSLCFLGAGIYDHFIPSAVKHVLQREEIYTAYTPYQPEISQGMLQSIFEYQSMICELTGMDAANASLYDGATALYEAALLAARHTGKKEILVARSVNPQYKKVLSSCFNYSDVNLKEVGFHIPDEVEGVERRDSSSAGGKLDLDALKSALSSNTAAVILQSPNFFGLIEDIAQVSEVCKAVGALLIVSADPISLGLFEAPGRLGADIVVGEAQPLGNPMNYGGPLLGYFAVKKPYIRKMPGRVVGETVDNQGRRGFVLTLQAREQHIRRDKATSNVCSNEALCALAAAVYLSLMGKQGLVEVGQQCVHKVNYACECLVMSGQAKKVFSSHSFREFVIKPSLSPDKLNEELLNNSIIGGFDLTADYPELEGCWLVAVTEKRTKEEIDFFVDKTVSIMRGGLSDET